MYVLTFINMNKRVNFRNKTITLSASLLAFTLIQTSGYAREGSLVPHPAITSSIGMKGDHQLGDWGEGIGRGWMETQGYEVHDPRTGKTGIDALGVKRNKLGEITEVRITEIKTRTDKLASLSDLEETVDGKQMSRSWSKARLRELAKSQDEVGEAARFALDNFDDTNKVSRQLNSYDVKNNRYMVSNVVDSPGGKMKLTEVATGRTTDVLKDLIKRSKNLKIASWAKEQVNNYDKIKNWKLPKVANKVVKNIAPKVAKNSAHLAKAGKSIARVAGKAMGPAAVLVEGGLILNRSDEIEAKVENGQITRKEAGKKHAGSIAAVGGGVGGGIGGAWGGLATGAAIGTAICPGVGTAIGGGIGAVAGGVGGGMAGDAAGKWIGEKAAESSKSIRDAANWSGRKMNNACDSVTETATAAGNQIKRSSRAASREIQKGWTSVKNCFSW